MIVSFKEIKIKLIDALLVNEVVLKDLALLQEFSDVI